MSTVSVAMLVGAPFASREDFLYIVKSGSLRSPPAPGLRAAAGGRPRRAPVSTLDAGPLATSETTPATPALLSPRRAQCSFCLNAIAPMGAKSQLFGV